MRFPFLPNERLHADQYRPLVRFRYASLGAPGIRSASRQSSDIASGRRHFAFVLKAAVSIAARQIRDTCEVLYFALCRLAAKRAEWAKCSVRASFPEALAASSDEKTGAENFTG